MFSPVLARSMSTEASRGCYIPLQLDFQTAVRCHVCAENWTQVPWRTASALKLEPSLQPQGLLLIHIQRKESNTALLRGKGTGRFIVAHLYSCSSEAFYSIKGHLFLGVVALIVSSYLDQVISLQYHSQELSYNLQWDKEFFSYWPLLLGPGKEPIKFLPQIMPKDNLKIQGYKSYNRGHWLNHSVIKIHSLPVLKANPGN